MRHYNTFLTEDILNRLIIISLFMPTVIELLGIRCEHTSVISLIPATIVSIFILSKVCTILKKLAKHNVEMS